MSGSSNGLRLPTDDGGEIVADLAVTPDAEPWAGTILCHPHPAYGGDRHNIVVDTLFRRLPEAGVTALRFDFRSDDIPTAQADVVAAIDHLSAAGVPLWLVGYSFGGDVALSVDHERIAGWAAVAPPLSLAPPCDAALGPERPVLLLAAEHDQFNPPDRMRETASTWHDTTVEAISGADHFMAGATAAVADAVIGWLGTQR